MATPWQWGRYAMLLSGGRGKSGDGLEGSWGVREAGVVRPV